MTTLVDSHCHIDFSDFDGEHAALIARAADAGVTRMVTICTRLRTDLDEPDGRQERDKEPQPTDDEIAVVACEQREPSDGTQKREACCGGRP